MPDPQQLLLFIAAGWLLNLTPGPDVLYIASNSLRSGTRAGVVAGLGVTAGCFVHVFVAAVGLGALLSASALAFSVLNYLGAGYLLWLGLRILLAKAPAVPDLGVPAASWMARRRSVRRSLHWLDRVAACMFIGFGLKLALSDNPTRH